MAADRDICYRRHRYSACRRKLQVLQCRKSVHGLVHGRGLILRNYLPARSRCSSPSAATAIPGDWRFVNAYGIFPAADKCRTSRPDTGAHPSGGCLRVVASLPIRFGCVGLGFRRFGEQAAESDHTDCRCWCGSSVRSNHFFEGRIQRFRRRAHSWRGGHRRWYPLSAFHYWRFESLWLRHLRNRGRSIPGKFRSTVLSVAVATLLLGATLLPAQEPIRRSWPAAMSPISQQSQISPRDAGIALVASAVLPGAGQFYLKEERWVPFAAIEAWGWISYANQKSRGRSLEQRYRNLAWDVARRVCGCVRRDTAFAYYEAMKDFNESGRFDIDESIDGIQPDTNQTAYNGSQWQRAKELYMG